MKLLDVVWGDQEGYVCISTLNREEGKGSWRDNIFQWPEDRSDIRAFIREYKPTHEVYWAPMVFDSPSRDASKSTPCPYLWADLDPVSPNSCVVRPSIAWESSPGRYQAIWLLESNISPSDHDELNKRLTYAVGADKSGWDLTQVLRLPDTYNHKYVEKPTVTVLWAEATYHDPNEIARLVPAVDTSSLISIEDLDIETAELRSLVFPYRAVLGNLWELIFAPPEAIQEGDRSDRLWEMECRLLAAGVPVTDVVKIVKACPWNKYAGRKDEDKRILTEVLKADKKVRKGPLVIPNGYDVPWVSYSQLLGKKMVGPGWMIEEIWANNSHGIIAGEPKTYKSVIVTEMMISVASGYPMWDKFKVNRTGPVLMVQEENAEWIVQDRLIKIAHSKGLLSGRVYSVNPKKGSLYVEFPKELPIRILNNWGFDLTKDEHREVLTREIDRVKPVMIILDPLYLMLGDLNDNSAHELREVLVWLLQLKTKYNTSIIILHHWNKGGVSPRGGQRMLGSTTLHAWVESALYNSLEGNDIIMEREFRAFSRHSDLRLTIDMSDPGQEPHYSVVSKAEDPSTVVRVEGGNKNHSRGKGLNSTQRAKVRHDNLLQFIRSRGVVTKRDIIEFEGISEPAYLRLVKRLKAEGLIEMTGDSAKRQLYKLTEVGMVKAEEALHL